MVHLEMDPPVLKLSGIIECEGYGLSPVFAFEARGADLFSPGAETRCRCRARFSVSHKFYDLVYEPLSRVPDRPDTSISPPAPWRPRDLPSRNPPGRLMNE